MARMNSQNDRYLKVPDRKKLPEDAVVVRLICASIYIYSSLIEQLSK